MCPSSHPGCESDGNCYKRSSSSYTWKGMACGSCTSSHSSSSALLKNSAMGSKYCYSYYGNSKTWCYTKKGDGSFAKSGCSSYNGYGPEWCCPDKIRCRADSPAPAPPATSSLTLRDSGTGSTGHCYSYYGSKKKTEWCYTKKKGGSFASSKCGSYDGHKTDWCCPEKVNCHTSGSSSGGCQASALGQYIADFVKGKKGQKVYSAMQGSASCWDLAWGAMEHAEKKGHNPIFWQKASHWADNNAWSSEVVPLEQAKPGDIAQFKGWKQNFNGRSKYAWNPHTAVVTECYKDGVLTTYEQNPDPVAEGKYRPHSKTSGSVTIYRLKSSTLRLHSQTPQLSVIGLHSGQFSVLAAVCATAVLLAFASFMVKRQLSVARSAPPTIEEGALLYPEMLDPEFVEVTAE